MAGWNIRVDGSTVIDVGTTKPKTLTGLTAGLHSFELQRYEDNGIESDWTDPIYAYLVDEVAIRLDAGRTTGGVIDGFDQDDVYLDSLSGTGDFADSVDVSGLTDPAPAADYSTYRLFTSEVPTYVFPSLIVGKTYLVRCHFNEGNVSHVIGDSVMQVNINASVASPIRDSAYRNTPYFDVRERAGAFHKGYIREYLGTADGSGQLVVEISNAVNNGGADVRIAAIEVLEAPPVASFTATPGANQTSACAFADTSDGFPTSWLWHFGDGNTSTLQNPSHTYSAAGDYEVTLVATNRFGDSETYTDTVTIPSASALTVTPSSLPDATDGSPYSEAIAATGGTFPYSPALVVEASDALEYTDLGSGIWSYERRGILPNGLSLASGSISGTPDLSAVKPSLIFLEGDSLVKGFVGADPNLTDDWTPGATLAKLLPRSWKVIVGAVSGTTLSQIAARYAANAAPLFDANYEKCIYFFAGGANDILGGTSLATMQTQTQNAISDAKADGFITIICKLKPYRFWAGADLTKANDYNSWIDATLTDIDLIIDWDDRPLLVNNAHNTYYNQGGLHNTELGYIEKGKLLRDAVDDVSASGSGAIAVDYKFSVKMIDVAGNAATKDYTLTVNP